MISDYYYYLLYTTYLLYALLFFGLLHNEAYITLVSNITQMFIALFLIIRFNPFTKTTFTKIDKKIAEELNKLFLEVIIANGFDREALKQLKKKKNLRLIDSSNYSFKEILKFVSSNEELLIQTEDSNKFSSKDFKVVSKKKPSPKQMKNLIFAFNVCRYVKSNAIVLASNETTAGIGSGQPSRLDSCQIAIDKMKKFVHTNDDVVAASDAFFPFVDGIQKLVQSGISAVIQPSGSIRDKEVINFANETDTILVFSKTRHFRH